MPGTVLSALQGLNEGIYAKGIEHVVSVQVVSYLHGVCPAQAMGAGGMECGGG